MEIFLRYLDEDRDRAGAQYEEIRRRLLTFFRCNDCGHEEELADDTLDRVIRRIGEVEVRHLMSFIRGVARHVVSEKQKRAKELSLYDVPEPVHHAADEELEQELDLRARCLSESLSRLDPDDRELVLAWYGYEKGSRSANTRRLADLRGTSPATLRVRAHRARRRLYRLVEDCLKQRQRRGVALSSGATTKWSRVATA